MTDKRKRPGRYDPTKRNIAQEAARYQANKVRLGELRRARYAANRDAELARNRIWRDDHLEQHRAQCRQWAKDHPEAMRIIVRRRRARLKNATGDHTHADILALHASQGGRCGACREPLDLYHVDHVMPLSRGGSNGRSNLQLLCPTCNRVKGAKLPHELPDGFVRPAAP